ncbi:DUF1746-domain-containing protein [Polychaeton citri CBS 116435]|uniref:DUF1746-domain-containing protein n=1 Tax=Polychaeton citri CBS 116435 TaxID=1314669 RepID=A0A9P4Q0U4_9PEZI|nr:DUF1746-domain-containing protein [Polychaeton citri CBS 116435]
MNDEPSSSSNSTATPYYNHNNDSARLSPAQIAEQRKKNGKLFNRKRSDLLEDLIRNVDILIFAELSTLYYMDCSFLRLILRGVVQFVLLTPKPALFPEPPRQRPYVGAIFGSNLFCIMMHILAYTPTGSEQTRGYLHGGLAMDFIGQKGPSSKLHLVLLDLLVLALQATHLAAYTLKESLKQDKKAAPGVRNSGAAAGTEAPAPSNTQTLDAEERGVRRSIEQQDIEMQALNPSGAIATAQTTSANDDRMPAAQPDENNDPDSIEESDPFLSHPPPNDAHIFDAFNSGQIVIADLALWTAVKQQFWAYQEVRQETETDGTRRRALRAQFAGRVLGMRFAQVGTNTASV